MRATVLQILLWISVIAWGSWFGGTLYQMLVVVPMWSSSPPESVREFFQGTDYNRYIVRFFGPPFMGIRTLPALLALIVGWYSPAHRYSLLLTVACLAFTVIFTFAYIYPINDVLFIKAGGDHSPDEIRQMATNWIFADRVRFAVGIVALLGMLWAFKQPIPPVDGIGTGN